MTDSIIVKRICKLIGVTYALTEEQVYQIYQDVGSIDRTLFIIQHEENPFKQLESN